MKIEFDERKSAKNERERGLPFWLVQVFDFDTATVIEDRRFAYPEARYVATGFIGERLYVVCFTPLPDGIRVISLRKANKREVAKYDEKALNR
jgi:uncharacterized DUF497 family protein